MTGAANGHLEEVAVDHQFTSDAYGQDTLLVHAGLPTHRHVLMVQSAFRPSWKSELRFNILWTSNRY